MDDEAVQGVLVRFRAFSLAMHERIRCEAPDGMSLQHILIMKTLATTGATRQTDFARILGISKGAVSQALAHLAEAGLIERRPDADDRRIHWIHPTRAALAMKKQMENRLTGLFRDLFQDWTPADGRRITRLLDDLIDRARDDSADTTPLAATATPA